MTTTKRTLPASHEVERQHSSQTILHAKLQQPRQLPGTVARPRLWARLDKGVQGAIQLVVAPAGFGKTTLVSSWLQQRAASGNQPGRAAWISLDRRDSSLPVFLRYFCAALDSLQQDACEDLVAMVNSPVVPTLSEIATVLNNTIYRVSDEFTLVLDDFHLVSNPEVHDLLTELARHWPAHMHMILISRHMPNLPLATLRVKGKLQEVDVDELRFNQAEVREYLHWVTDTEPAPQIAEQFTNKTEGWIAGLHLAALALKRSGHVQTAAHTHDDANANLADYMIEDVLANEDPAILSFLYSVSVLDRLCLPLCEALIDSLPGQLTPRQCLDWLVDSNFFIVPLDEEGVWYRLHRLLNDALRQRAASQFGEHQLVVWRRRAAAWFEQQGMIEDALSHAIVLNDLGLMAKLVEAGFLNALHQEDRPTLERWLRLFPTEFVAQHPGLLFLKATTLQMSWRLAQLRELIEEVDALLARNPNAATSLDKVALLGTVSGFRAELAYFRNDAATGEAYAREAFALLPQEWEYFRGGTSIYWALSVQAMGRFHEVDAAFQTEYLTLADGHGCYVLRLLLAMITSAIFEGQLERAHQYASLMVDKAKKSPMYLMRSWAQYWKGVIEFEWGWSGTAIEHFGEVAERRLVANAHAVRNSLIGLAMLQAEAGKHTEAAHSLNSLSQYDISLQGIETAETGALRAWLAAIRGDWASAQRWAGSWQGPVPNTPLAWLISPHLVKARILIQHRRPADLQEADVILAALERIARDTHNVRYQVYLRVTRALYLDATGDAEGALGAMRDAIQLAEPGGFVRAFAQPGQRVREMLMQIARAEPDNRTVYLLLRDIARTNARRTDTRPRATRQPLPEPLTPRELDVLRLMRERRSDKEIAIALGISVGTVKRHSANLFVKLNVNRRWEAVVRAEELAIL